MMNDTETKYYKSKSLLFIYLLFLGLFMNLFSCFFCLTVPSFIMTIVSLDKYNKVENDLLIFSMTKADEDSCDSESLRNVMKIPIISNSFYLFLTFVLLCYFCNMAETFKLKEEEVFKYLYKGRIFCILFLIIKFSTSLSFIKNESLEFDCFKEDDNFSSFIDSLETLILIEKIFLSLSFIFSIFLLYCTFLQGKIEIV